MNSPSFMVHDSSSVIYDVLGRGSVGGYSVVRGVKVIRIRTTLLHAIAQNNVVPGFSIHGLRRAPLDSNYKSIHGREPIYSSVENGSQLTNETAGRSTDFIALHESLASHPVAQFHEMGEYLISAGLIRFELSGEELLVRDGSGAEFGHLKLSLATLGFIEQERWEEGWQTNPHYLLRVFQREVFGQKDAELTNLIQYEKMIRLLPILPIVERHGFGDSDQARALAEAAA